MTQLDNYQKYIHLSRYARWRDDLGRRENFEETVSRYVDFFSKKWLDYPKDLVKNAILNLEVMPSMRALMTAGPALERDQVGRIQLFFCGYRSSKSIR